MIKILEYLNEHYSASSTKGYENMINKYRAYMQSKAQRANYHDIMGYVSYLKSNLHQVAKSPFAIKNTIVLSRSKSEKIIHVKLYLRIKSANLR
jgi:hypothetical protein